MALLTLANLLNEAVVANTLLVATLLTLADKLLEALLAIALLADALLAVAEKLVVAVLTLALGVVALVALADDKLVGVVLLALGAPLGVAEIIAADDAVLLAVRAVAVGKLGNTVVTVAEDGLLGVRQRGGLRAEGGGDGVDSLVADGAVADLRGAGSDGVSGGDGGGDSLRGSRDTGDEVTVMVAMAVTAVCITDADVHGQASRDGHSLAAGQAEGVAGTSAELALGARADAVALAVIGGRDLRGLNNVTAVAVTVVG